MSTVLATVLIRPPALGDELRIVGQQGLLDQLMVMDT